MTRSSLVILLLALVLLHPVATFAPPIRIAKKIRRRGISHQQPCLPLHRQSSHSVSLYAAGRKQDDDEDETPENPYADPNYPDLEFVNYADPEYQVDMGMSDEFYDDPSSSSSDDAEDQVEAMREERRRRNDEFQFQTYYQKVLRNGEAEFRGEWTVYQTSTFLDGGTVLDRDDDNGEGLPDLVETGSTPLTVVSRGYKELVETNSPFAVDAERIRHVEEIRQPSVMFDADIDGLMSDIDGSQNSEEQQADTEKEIMVHSYWPDALKALDFRGHQGIMVCGK